MAFNNPEPVNLTAGEPKRIASHSGRPVPRLGLTATCLAIWLFYFFFVTPSHKNESPAPTVPSGPAELGGVPGLNFPNLRAEHFQVNVYSGGQPTTAAPPAAPVRDTASTIVENGGFEQGTDGWGIGFFESVFASPEGSALLFTHAVARWYIDDRRPHDGRRSLRVENDTTNAPDVFSSFGQRIRVTRERRYEVKYWAYLESTDGKGSFSLRVLPSRRTKLDEWNKFRGKINPSLLGQWQEMRFVFDSGHDSFYDLRFAAETKMKLWVDDVSVALLEPGNVPGTR